MIDAPTCLGTLMVSFSVILLKRNAGKMTLSGFCPARPELDEVPRVVKVDGLLIHCALHAWVQNPILVDRLQNAVVF